MGYGEFTCLLLSIVISHDDVFARLTVSLVDRYLRVSKVRLYSTKQQLTTIALSLISLQETSMFLFSFSAIDTKRAEFLRAYSTYENYFFRFVDSAGSIIQPADNRWWAVGDSRDPGTLMPWNRRMQIVHGALKLAAAHETPAAFNSNLTKYYDDLVQRNVMDFLGALNTTRGRVEGMDIFDWDYVSPKVKFWKRL